MECLVEQQIEMQLNKNKCNRDGGFLLSYASSHITNMIKNIKAGLATSCNRQI
jgi:hypothetical protein